LAGSSFAFFVASGVYSAVTFWVFGSELSFMRRIEDSENPIVRKVLIGATILLGVLLVVMSFRWSFGPTAAAKLANEKMFVCSKTGKSFSVTLKLGMKIPVHSPYSGEDTGYPAEECWWTAGGQIKNSPDYVLVDSEIGKPGPTFCPVCGRLVVPRNPHPMAGDRPPPTEAEYRAGPQASGAK
jgi:hypothetical protein